MNTLINNTITITGKIENNYSGTKDWGIFKITSERYISDRIVEEIALSHGFGGQSFSFQKISEKPYVYDGEFSCWSD